MTLQSAALGVTAQLLCLPLGVGGASTVNSTLTVAKAAIGSTSDVMAMLGAALDVTGATGLYIWV